MLSLEKIHIHDCENSLTKITFSPVNIHTVEKLSETENVQKVTKLENIILGKIMHINANHS